MAEGLDTAELLLERIREKDGLILELRKALDSERARHGDIVRAMALLLPGAPSADSPAAAVSPVQSDVVAVDHPSTDAPDPLAPIHAPGELPDLVLRELCTGIYKDNWLRPRSSLVIAGTAAGRNVTLKFFLPRIADGQAKEMSVAPSFATPFKIAVRRGQPVLVTCAIPPLPESSARIDLDVEPEPKSGGERRDLGILLLSAASR